MTADEILSAARDLLLERGQDYDTPEGERSVADVVRCFNVLTRGSMSVEEGWLFMVLLKLVRSQYGYKADNYQDAAAYVALMGESAECMIHDFGHLDDAGYCGDPLQLVRPGKSPNCE